MEIRNCKKCGKIYQYDGTHKICLECRRKEEEDFEKVKEFLRNNPNSSIKKVSEETGVEKKIILEFIKDERLIAGDIELEVTLKCERCGREIKHGKYCEKCIADMKKEIDEISSKKENDDKNQRKKRENMHVRDRLQNN
ncbi:MAG TPA: TIGR03826 family flagellar region protein [Halanaerobiales bacterium]|nr:TIGR03826 family flagellar region protein [Halanaerobiales bacterium]